MKPKNKREEDWNDGEIYYKSEVNKYQEMESRIWFNHN